MRTATRERSNRVDVCRRAAMQGLNIPAKPQFSLNTRAIDYLLVRLYSRQEKKVFKLPIRCYDQRMKNFRLLLSCRLFLALVVATLFASGVAEAQPAVPFKATIVISESIQEILSPPCILVGDISGTGLATQLGRVTLVSSDCINPTDQTFTAFSFLSNHVVFTVAANGDQIFATYSGTLTFEGTVGVITGGYQIEGGTGRYSHAFGAGIVQGVEDRITGKGNVQLTGTISY